ncbi:ABC transporter ATP-binding protein [Bacillus testis]|uniref:ABC transporter ATP-binding protein n=1 Tax=Bacillus testis TaxID=1622072 RepID=UPI00067ED738|nr:ABC transporter ATP-binding protein [Bacillus testis]
MIEIKGLSKKYRLKQVLKDVSFTVKKGEITCLIGVNGTGKSTTMKAVMGLIPFKEGDITVDGISVKKERGANVSLVPDHLTMPSGMTIKQAFQFMIDFYPTWNDERAEELMDYFNLSYGDKIHHLSKGNASKLNLLLGLSFNSDYVLMDEPFSGIDMFAKEKIRDLFSSPYMEGRGILLTTHEIDEVEHLLDRVVILDRGRIVEDFYTEQVRVEEGKSVVDKLREVHGK